MKKLLPVLLIATMLFSLAGCSGSSEQSNASASPAPASSSSNDTTSSPPSDTDPQQPKEEPVSESSHSLIAYFSWSGHTEQLANMIQAETGGDLFAIETKMPYTDDYDAVVDQAKQEQEENARPALASQVENMDDYDTIFIGYPNWWNDVPMAVLTFMESYDWTGKTIIPFCTSGGGGFGQGVRSIEAAADGAVFLEGFHVNGSSVDGAATDVSAWLNTVKNQ